MWFTNTIVFIEGHGKLFQGYFNVISKMAASESVKIKQNWVLCLIQK